MKAIRCISLTVLIGLVLLSCKKEAMNPASGQTGTFKVRMTDAPGNFTGLFVQVKRVDVFIEQRGWVNLSSDDRLISVLDLTNGAETTLAFDGEAPAGTYSKVKLTFGDENSLLMTGDSGSSTVGLNFSAQQSNEVIIDVGEQVTTGASTEVLLDFNVAESIWQIGDVYLIHPVITEIEDESTGVSGDVEGCVQASVTLFNSGHSYHTYVTASGEFLIRGVADGTYQLSVEGMVEGRPGLQETTVSNVSIVKGQINTMGAIRI